MGHLPGPQNSADNNPVGYNLACSCFVKLFLILYMSVWGIPSIFFVGI